MNAVKAWKENVTIPSYETGEPGRNPVFLEKRVYQGSSGVVYPYPVIEKIFDEKKDKTWQAVFLENEYLKIMILPELGGRVQMAYDKVRQRHFVYYNRVIKPALVGLAGPWISGGIEFNWPQHHRPGTFTAVDCMIGENSDGSKTVWCSEVERMFRTKGMAGFTLYPDKAYLEINVKLFNGTPRVQTFLWWANPAVKVNDDYQSVFPPDVHAVFDHGKRDVSTFPIATGTYYKVDYSAGVDISRYKNIPVPTSYMAIRSEYDFIGCYENDTQGGMLHVANHHISPGKKQWTWGNGDFGRAWDRNLTDEDGPYIELMCGVYTDNQPDFSWLMPYEEKSFSQYFMPYHSIGAVKNATKDILVNLEFSENTAYIGICATSVIENAVIELLLHDKIICSEMAGLSPRNHYEKRIAIDSGPKVVKNQAGNELIRWQAEKPGEKSIPEPAKAAKSPREIQLNEQLFLTGLHLEQYRHATLSPSDYYLEALRRDPGDVRCNNAMGLLEMKKANFAEACRYFETAIATPSERNPNPYDGEPYFNLGMALRFQEEDDKAYNAFYKAVWNYAWQGAGYFQLAQLATKKGEYDEALDLVERSLMVQWNNHKARHLKVILLRKKEETGNALDFIEASLNMDAFNFGILYEKYRITPSDDHLGQLRQRISDNIHNYIETALDYAWAGLFDEAADLLTIGVETQKAHTLPMAWYYLGWFSSLTGQKGRAREYYLKGEREDPGTCFPNQPESVQALNDVAEILEKPAMAPYYLGNFYYHTRAYQKAIDQWELSVKNKTGFATSRRNLALAYFNKANKKSEALQQLEKAFSLNPSDARVFMELDALYKRLNKPCAFRLEKMEQHASLVAFRDDLYIEKITLLNLLGKHSPAFDLIMKCRFHPWEGGEGKVTGQYVFSLVEMAKENLKKGDTRIAIEQLQRATAYPHNLGEGKLYGARENDIYYWKGCCYEKEKDMARAKESWEAATQGKGDPGQAMFYNDQQPDKIFYRGLALRKLNEKEQAGQEFSTLYEYGKAHLNDEVRMDYFAVSFPDLLIWDDDLNARNHLHCQYLMALGHLGMGKVNEARSLLENIHRKDAYHAGAHLHLKMIGNGMINYF